MRVLLVEDDPTISKSIELMLTHANLNVYCTDLGEEGVDLAKLYDYDLILLDLNLPDMTGHDVLRQLRMAKVETPILTNSLTAKPSQSLRFASAVAAYADLLRGGKNIGEWNWNNVSETAQASLGEDRYGLRREFVGLVQQGQKIVANEGNAPKIAGE